MSITLGSTGGGSVTLQEPTTASTRTLTLPDATGTMALTSDIPAAGGITFLGTLTISATTNGSLSSLNLTTYSFLYIVSTTAIDIGTGTDYLLIGNSTSDDVQASALQNGTANPTPYFCIIDLNNGIGVGHGQTQNSATNNATVTFDSAVTTASTSVSIASLAGTFSGSFRFYGVK